MCPPPSSRASIATTGVSAVVTNDELAGAVPGIVHAVASTPLRVAVLAPDEPRAVTPDQAIVQFTSGTTGAPKAVVLRHDTVGELLDTVIGSLRGARQGDRARMPNLVPMSLSLWAGIYQVLFAFKLGVPVVLMAAFEPQEFARLVREHGIRSSVLPPAALVMLTDDPAVTSLEPLRYVRSVSAPLSPAHARRFHERFGVAILNGYGQTELGGEAIGWSAADWKEFGADEARRGRSSARRVRAARRGPTTARSARPTMSASWRSARPPPLPPADAAMEGRVTPDGWLRTGDLARIDADGFVWIEGRVSAMINRGGLKVFPDEVEECIRGHRRCRRRRGRRHRRTTVSARSRGPSSSARVDLVTLQDHCRAELAPYKVPAGVTLVAALRATRWARSSAKTSSPSPPTPDARPRKSRTSDVTGCSSVGPQSGTSDVPLVRELRSSAHADRGGEGRGAGMGPRPRDASARIRGRISRGFDDLARR